jgi:peptidoglycan/xylan/chitin deacetylase (PgdA/CDA1 family)
MNRTICALIFIIVALAILSAGCSQQAPTATSTPLPTEIPTNTPEPTPLPTNTPEPTPTVVRTPPALPGIYQPTYLNVMDYPHTYIEDACQYLQLKWNPDNAAPGTVVMVIMFHSIANDNNYGADDIAIGDFRNMMETLHEQNFEAITAEQLADFLDFNAYIPARSVLLVVDDRHYAQYFNNFFRQYWEEYGWPVVNAWISHPETLQVLWEEMEGLAQEGWVDFQAHGVIHNIIIDDYSSDEFISGELNGSIEAIQNHFGKPPVAYIWAGGGFTQRGVQLARFSGYRVGFTINPRGPIMFNWIPLADQKDPMRPVYLPEGEMFDPRLVLPRYWPSQVIYEIDNVRVMGKEAAAYAEQVRPAELEYYDIVCEPEIGPIPGLNP